MCRIGISQSSRSRCTSSRLLSFPEGNLPLPSHRIGQRIRPRLHGFLVRKAKKTMAPVAASKASASPSHGHFSMCSFVRTGQIIFLDFGRASRYVSRTAFLCSQPLVGLRMQEDARYPFSTGQVCRLLYGCKLFMPWKSHRKDTLPMKIRLIPRTAVAMFRVHLCLVAVACCALATQAQTQRSTLPPRHFTARCPALSPDRSACRPVALRRQAVHAAADAHAL